MNNRYVFDIEEEIFQRPLIRNTTKYTMIH